MNKEPEWCYDEGGVEFFAKYLKDEALVINLNKMVAESEKLQSDMNILYAECEKRGISPVDNNGIQMELYE